jgi:hypothetical protein
MGSVVQRPVRGTSVSHHERPGGELLEPSLSTRHTDARQANARRATRQPGSRPAVGPDSSGHKPGLTSDDARKESRRNSRQMVASASVTSTARLWAARLLGRESGGGSNG